MSRCSPVCGHLWGFACHCLCLTFAPAFHLSAEVEGWVGTISLSPDTEEETEEGWRRPRVSPLSDLPTELGSTWLHRVLLTSLPFKYTSYLPQNTPLICKSTDPRSTIQLSHQAALNHPGAGVRQLSSPLQARADSTQAGQPSAVSPSSPFQQTPQQGLWPRLPQLLLLLTNPELPLWPHTEWQAPSLGKCKW